MNYSFTGFNKRKLFLKLMVKLKEIIKVGVSLTACHHNRYGKLGMQGMENWEHKRSTEGRDGGMCTEKQKKKRQIIQENERHPGSNRKMGERSD